QAEDGIRDFHVTGVQTCALPIFALASVAETAIFPLQDLLGLGTEARMNTPGTAEGNWTWRFEWDQITPDAEKRLAEMTAVYERRSEERRVGKASRWRP